MVYIYTYLYHIKMVNFGDGLLWFTHLKSPFDPTKIGHETLLARCSHHRWLIYSDRPKQVIRFSENYAPTESDLVSSACRGFHILHGFQLGPKHGDHKLHSNACQFLMQFEVGTVFQKKLIGVWSYPMFNTGNGIISHYHPCVYIYIHTINPCYDILSH